MTLTADFNLNAKPKRRISVAETDTFGAHALSRYFCSLAMRRSLRVEQEQVIVHKPVIQAAPVVIRRGMNI